MRTRQLLRPITGADVSDVLALNLAHVDLLAPMDAARLEALQGWSDHCSVIEQDGAFAGFVITFGPGTDYDSENYRWFSEAYEDFYYLDRIVLKSEHRRSGLGTLVYDALEGRAREHGRMALEVNVEPPNEPSLAFHRQRGYREVGRRGEPGHLVSLMVKELP